MDLRFIAVARMEASRYLLSKVSESERDEFGYAVLPEGSYRALLASSAQVRNPPEFDRGGVFDLTSVTAASAETVLAGYIAKECSQKLIRVLFEDPFADGAAIANVSSDLLRIGARHYFRFSGDRGTDQKSIAQLIRRFTSAWSFKAIILRDGKHFPRDLTGLVSNARAIVVDAYDGESYLEWRRDD